MTPYAFGGGWKGDRLPQQIIHTQLDSELWYLAASDRHPKKNIRDVTVIAISFLSRTNEV